MYEPKYKLNKRDEARFRKLAVKEALGRATLEERVELDKLSKKFTRKRWRHPKMQAVKRRNRNLHRRLMRAATALDNAIDKAPAIRRRLGKERFADSLRRR